VIDTMIDLRAEGLYGQSLGRIPTPIAQAIFRGDPWLSTADPAITTALDAAAENTRIAWTNDWAVFRAWATERAAHWYDEHARIRLPMLPEVLGRFVADVVSGYDGHPPRAIATVRRYLTTVSTLHRLLSIPDPTKAAVVRNTLKARARLSGGQAQAAPFRWADVEAALQLLPDTLLGLRDKTPLAVGHNTLARRAELVALDVADIELQGETAIARLRPTKARLEAEPDPRFLSAPATALVREWLARSGLTEGPLFAMVHRHGGARATNGQRGRARAWLPRGRRIAPEEVASAVKRAAAAIAESRGEVVLPPPNNPLARRLAVARVAAAYSGHSLRVGAAQDMAAAGVPTAAILQAGGWSDERMIKRYLRKLNAAEGVWPNFFGRPIRPDCPVDRTFDAADF